MNTELIATASELVCGDIWQHTTPGFTFYSLSPCPSATVQQYATLQDAWTAHRQDYDEGDIWAKGWDAHFAGRETYARRLWAQWLNQQGAAYNPEPPALDLACA